MHLLSKSPIGGSLIFFVGCCVDETVDRNNVLVQMRKIHIPAPPCRGANMTPRVGGHGHPLRTIHLAPQKGVV